MSAWRVCEAGLCPYTTMGGLWKEHLSDNKMVSVFILSGAGL